LNTNKFDPLAYIESAFLDSEGAHEGGAAVAVRPETDELTVDIPTISAYLSDGVAKESDAEPMESLANEGPKKRFRKTVMSAPRPRRAKREAEPETPPIDPELRSTWEALPRNVAFLCSFYDDSVTKNYYRGEFKESRQELIQRLLDPVLSLEETSRLLGVCPATVRRYTNRGWLTHHRSEGGQRRFRLSDIVKFVDAHGRFPQE
jgi:excisionase family DNA binding protein